LVCFTLFTGCQEAYLTDDIDVVLDFNPLTVDDALHSPYVIGATVKIVAHSKKKHDSTLGWRLEIDDPDVMEVVKQRDGRATCVAVGAGYTTVRVYSDVGVGKLIHKAEIQVREPTHAKMYAHGPLLVGQKTGRAHVEEPTVLSEKTGTFLVRYFDGETRLFGNGALEVLGHESVTFTTETTYLFENREWLQIRPQKAGRHVFELRAAGIPLGEYAVNAVEKDDVEGLILHKSQDWGAHFGEQLLVWAEAFDIAGNTVFGVEPRWVFDGQPETRVGDLYRYHYNPNKDAVVEAFYRGHEAATTIHAGSEGYVDSTNKVGCTFTGMADKRSSTGLFLLLLAIIPFALLRASSRKNRDDVSQ